MKQTDHVAQAVGNKKHDLTPKQKSERKQRVLTQGTPSVVRNISDAIVIKEGDIYFLTLPDGRVPMSKGHGYGLYYHDCRFLNGYDMKVADVHPSSLVASAERGYMSLFQLTNPDLRMEDGTIKKEHIGIEWERLLDSNKLMLSDLLTFENFSGGPGRLPDLLRVSRRVRGRIRGARLAAEEAGQIAGKQMGGWSAQLHVRRGGRPYRSVSIYFSEKPQSTDDNKVHFDIKLKPRERQQLLISTAIAETKKKADARPKERFHPDVKGAAKEFDTSADRWMGPDDNQHGSLLVNNVLDRSLRDLHVLKSGLDGEGYFAAGLPGSAPSLAATA